MADRSGQRLGNYRLLHLLGVGGFAEVYLGEHVYLKTQAAIKVLHSRLAADDLEGFLGEARTIARLVHPHIVRVLEFGVEGGTAFLVMDYAPHGTLRQRHPKGTRLPAEMLLPYVQQVVHGLQHAHEEKLVHRDIKPENMLLGRHNEVLLSDFGIATVAQSSRYQGTQEVAGTVAYMAPEQVQGKPRPASDQYSLGIVVYEWLTGTRPFQGSFTEIATQQMFTPPPPLREKLPTISPGLEEVVLTALAKDPKERFGSVRAFANALEQAITTGTAALPKPTTPISGVVSPSGTLRPSGSQKPSEVLAPFQPAPSSGPFAPTEYISSGLTPPSGVLTPAPEGSGDLGPTERVPKERAPSQGALEVDASSSLTLPTESGSFSAPAPDLGKRQQEQQRSRRWVKVVAALLLVVILGAAASGLAYLLTRPKPVITITSDIATGSPLSGPADTVLHVHGQDFSSNSAITFLLDGQPAPDVPTVKSDGQGNIQADLTISDNWLQGTHTLTARDASGYVTKSGVSLMVIPDPLISLTSLYFAGSTPAGSTGTTIGIKGRRFAPDSAITILLDGQPLSGVAPRSDAYGVMGITEIPIGPNWAQANHTITARDAQGNTAENKATLAVVAQGVAGTPGPNGAPADNASFQFHATFQGVDGYTGKPYSFGLNLLVDGHPDPAGGAVCGDRDDGQPRQDTGELVTSGTDNPTGVKFTQTLVYNCVGGYKSGKLTYTEKVISDQFVLSNGDTCRATRTYISVSLSGTFSDATHISGQWSDEKPIYNCTGGFSLVGLPAEQNTWSATL